MREVRQIARSLRRSPGFSLAAFGTLAVTIGSAAAIFSFVDAILLRPLPYTHPQRVFMLWETRKGAPPRGSSSSAPRADPRQTEVSASEPAGLEPGAASLRPARTHRLRLVPDARYRSAGGAHRD